MDVTKFRPGPPTGAAHAEGNGAVGGGVSATGRLPVVLAAAVPVPVPGAAPDAAPGPEPQGAVAPDRAAGARLAITRRRDTLRVLEGQVRRGTYVADAAIIASAMIAEAALAVELRAAAHA